MNREPLLLPGHRWVFRGYRTLDDFVNNTNPLYTTNKYPYGKRKPGKHNDKYIYILSKYFFEGLVPNKYWLRFESSPEFDDCVFIYEDHEESINLDYRWFEVMRKRKKGIYIPDQTPRFYNEKPDTVSSPIVVPGYFILYDKYKGEPFLGYQFTNPNSPFKKLKTTGRDIDISYIGGKRDQRVKYVRAITAAAKKLNLKYEIRLVGAKTDKGKVQGLPGDKYLESLRRSKISYNFMGVGYRTGREWESLINGALLINDDRTVDQVYTPGIVAGKDFVKFDPDNVVEQMRYWITHENEREKVVRSGFEAAWKVWDGCNDPYMPGRRDAAEYIKRKGWDK